ncbi:MAG: HlyD family secretion protein [Halioglobus sp.]
MANSPEENEGNAAQSDAGQSSRRGAIVLLVVIALMLVYHLASDRFTPYTQQARVYANIVSLAAEVGGKVTQVHALDNQNVKAGDPLVSIDQAPYEIALQKARADLSATRRELEAADGAILVAQANLAASEAELERAQKERDRHESLYGLDNGAISLRRVEVSRANLKKAASRVESSKAQVAQSVQARGSKTEDNDRIQAARSAVDKATLDLERTLLRAPGDGLITNLGIDTGQFASPGKPIMTFIAIHDVWVSADMTENNLGHLRVGDEAEVVFDIMPGRVFKAAVRSVSFGVNTKKEPKPGQLSQVENSKDFLRQAQRFPVILEMVNADRADLAQLKIGGQADVIVYTSTSVVTRWIGRLYIRAMGFFSYLY